jgi:sugar phosphate isomerase/epimerase
VNRDAKLARLAEFTAQLQSEAGELGIELLLENMIPDRLGYSHIMASDLGEWAKLVADAGCGAVLDTGHSAATGISLHDVFDTLGSSVRAIHRSDNDTTSDLHLLPADGNDVTAGLAAILSDIGYDGVITYEISPLHYSLDHIIAHITAEAGR